MKNLLLLITIVLSTNLSSQDFDRQKMDRLFKLIESYQKGMGSISIFEGGKEAYQYAFGYAGLEEDIKATDKTKYRIGSISKTFTATIIMKLIEEGKLSLSTKLSEYYPEIQNSPKITMEQLLKHRSGIFNFTNADNFKSWMEQPISKADLVKKIVANGNVFEPNAKYEYSNSNYVLLSFIAEKAANKALPQLIQEMVCLPCTLDNTYYGSKIATKNNEAKSYTKSRDWQLASESDMSIPQGAGAIVSTPRELNKFLNCLFNYKIVSEKTVGAMMEIEDGYGLGMFQVPFYDKKAYGHNGAIDGFQSNAYYFPIENVSVAFTANGLAIPINDIMIGVLSIYFGKKYSLPEFQETKALILQPEDLDIYLGLYSSPGFPLKITITKKDNILIGQATNQPAFPLEAFETDKFRFEQAGLILEFIPVDHKMILKQGGGKYELTKE